MAPTSCHSCRSKRIKSLSFSDNYQRITSDAKLNKGSSKITHCLDCNLVQTTVNQEWKRNIEQIYFDYEIYHQANGEEQKVFLPCGGVGTKRSEAIFHNLSKQFELPEKGNLLDVGCGNGSFLKVFSKRMPKWDLHGSEFDGKYKEKVEGIPSVQKMHTVSLSQINMQFDLISMIHVLEHIPNPLKTLSEIRRMLSPTGVLIVQVPNPTSNPFATMIADHCSHFTINSLNHLLYSSGFSVLNNSTEWVSREISVIAKNKGTINDLVNEIDYDQTTALVESMKWLGRVKAHTANLFKENMIYIFGSAISATFTASQYLENIFAFVDEDESRVGKTHLGKAIIHPNDLSFRGPLYIPFPPPFGERIATRIKDLNSKLKVYFTDS